MPYYSRRTRYGRKLSSRRRLRKKKSTRGKKSSTSFNKKVLKVIHRASETKQMNPVILYNNRVLPVLSDVATQCVPLIPILAQGTGQGERVGNQVSTVKAMLNLNITSIAISTSSGYVPPIYFDIYIYKWKRSDNVGAIDLTKFLQYGNTSIPYDSTQVPPCGNLKVNADSFTLKYHKRILLWNQTASQQNAPAGGALTNCSNLLNAKNLNIDITKFLNKNMKYQDAITNTPNDNLWVSVVATPNDQDPGYNPSQVFGDFDMMLQYQYDDF